MTTDPLLFDIYCDLPICGCGDPASAVMLIRSILERHSDNDFPRELEDLLPDETIRHIVLASLTNINVLEHGGTIEGSWLTENGKHLLASMRESFAMGDDDAAEAWMQDAGGLELTTT